MLTPGRGQAGEQVRHGAEDVQLLEAGEVGEGGQLPVPRLPVGGEVEVEPLEAAALLRQTQYGPRAGLDIETPVKVKILSPSEATPRVVRLDRDRDSRSGVESQQLFCIHSEVKMTKFAYAFIDCKCNHRPCIFYLVYTRDHISLYFSF